MFISCIYYLLQMSECNLIFRFPTIYWAPMGSKDNPKKYQGGREVNDFIEFIKKEATNAVDVGEETKKKKKQKKEL